MVPMLSDTHPDAERVQLEGLRALSPWRKIELACELTENARKLALAGLRQRFPNASEKELQRRLATLCLGAKLAEEVYGPEPDAPTSL
jgi:hypothetical protein